MLNRRTFVNNSALLAAGAVAGVGMAGASMAQASEGKDAKDTKDAKTAEVEAPAFPFTWHKLDHDVVEADAYDHFGELGGCSRTVFSSIVGSMAETYGYPYNQIPTEIFHNGHAGYNMGSLCGCIGGAAGVMGLFIPTEDVDAQLAILQNWYMETEFPIYEPDGELVKTVANSINCLDSLGTWMAAADITDRSDPKRIARCSGLSADVARKTCEIIDEYYGLTDAEVGATPKA